MIGDCLVWKIFENGLTVFGLEMCVVQIRLFVKDICSHDQNLMMAFALVRCGRNRESLDCRKSVSAFRV